MKLRKTIEKEHPSLHQYQNKRTFDGYAETTYAQINRSMTAKDFYILLSRLVEKVNCGHTFLSLPKGYWESAHKFHKYFPFKLHYQNNKAFVLQNYGQESILPPGSEILTVNDITMSSIIENFLNIISSDGSNQTYKYAKMNRIDYGLFPGYSEFPDSFHVTYKPKGDSSEKIATIYARTFEEIFEVQKRQSTQNIELKQYEFEMIDSLSTAIITIRDFVPDDPDDYVDFLRNAFKIIQEEGIQIIILDVRDNDGGDPHHAAELLSYLTEEPFIYFHNHVIGYQSLKRPINPHPLNFGGNVYVLVDGGCFSTTGHFLSLIKYHSLGTLIGEETGGSFRCYGCPEELTLPNTGIVLQYMRCTFSANVRGFTFGRGILPDIEIRLHVEDLINGRDTIKMFAFDAISKIIKM